VKLSDAKVFLVKNGYPDEFKPIDDNSVLAKSAEKFFLFLESKKSLTPENINIIMKHLPIVDLLFKKISNEKAPNETINLQHHINSISRSSRKITQFLAIKKAGLHKPFDATVAEIRKAKDFRTLIRENLFPQASACVEYCKRLNHVDGMHVLANAIFSKFDSLGSWLDLAIKSERHHTELCVLRDVLYDVKGIYQQDKVSQANDAGVVFKHILTFMNSGEGRKFFWRIRGPIAEFRNNGDSFPLWMNPYKDADDGKNVDDGKEAQTNILFSHAGGLFHILALLKGERGCLYDGHQGCEDSKRLVGAYVHPILKSNEQRPKGHKRDRFYATRSSMSFFDIPAAMFGEIKANQLNNARNWYEAFITTKNFRNAEKPTIRLVTRDAGQFCGLVTDIGMETLSEDVKEIAYKTSFRW